MTILTETELTNSALSQTFTLKSTELGGQLNKEQYFNGMGFSGENRSPQLYWEHAPKENQSFAVTIYDMDAPTGSGLWHWVIFNIPADVNTLEPDAGNADNHLLPSGTVKSNTDMGIPDYVGAAPPGGPAHRYLITVYTLSEKLNLDKNATPAFVGFNMHFITLAKASLLVYGQKQ